MALSHVEDVVMGRKKHTAEEIVAKLRQVDVLVSQGRKVAEAIRSIEVTEVAARRTPQRRGVLHPQGSLRRDRTMAEGLQHHPATLLAGLPPACTAGRHLAHGT